MRLSLSWRLAGILLCALVANVSVAASGIEGVWVTGDGDGLVELKYRGDQLTGFISGTLSDPEGNQAPRYDILNPDSKLRSRALLGLEIFSKLAPSGEKQWKGEVYDPDSGKTYKCTIKQVGDNQLELRGYIGFSLLGRTESWTRK